MVAVGFMVLAVFQPELNTLDANGQPVTVPNPISIDGIPDEEDGPVAAAFYVSLVVLAVSALASLVVRYRRADVELRAQLKWLLYAVTLLVGWMVLDHRHGSNPSSIRRRWFTARRTRDFTVPSGMPSSRAMRE